MGDGGGRHKVVRPGPSFSLVGQVDKMTGRTDCPVANTAGAFLRVHCSVLKRGWSESGSGEVFNGFCVALPDEMSAWNESLGNPGLPEGPLFPARPFVRFVWLSRGVLWVGVGGPPSAAE